jgi:FLVCR family feline leukemia virus subgroup C receptor-related protein
MVVNLGGLLFSLMHPIFTFPASYVIDTFGTRIGITVGAVLALIGVGIRMLVNVSGFGWVIAGQVIAGIGRPFILNCQAKIPANWFSAQTRGQVTQILTLVLNVSLIAGFFIPFIFFRNYELSEADFREQGRSLTFQLMAAEAILTAVCLLPNIIFQESKPPTPPSESGSMEREPFKIAVPKMLKNVNYVLLLTAFGCYFGIFNAISIALSYMLTPFFTDNVALAATLVGSSPIISGIMGVFILGPIQRKEGVFKKWIIICMCGMYRLIQAPCWLHSCSTRCSCPPTSSLAASSQPSTPSSSSPSSLSCLSSAANWSSRSARAPP